jgi:hypothetical protein
MSQTYAAGLRRATLASAADAKRYDLRIIFLEDQYFIRTMYI